MVYVRNGIQTIYGGEMRMVVKNMVILDLKIIKKLVNDIPEIENNPAIDKNKCLNFVEETIKKYKS